MIALRDRTKARRRPFAPGDIVRLDWPRNLYHGARGRVDTVDGDQVGVTWRLHGDGFFVVSHGRRLKLVKKGAPSC